MKAVLLPDRGVIRVSEAEARRFLNGLLTADVTRVSPATPAFAALLTPQGKIIADCIVAEAPAETGGGFYLDCPRALSSALVERLSFYKLRAKVGIEFAEALGVMAIWGGTGGKTEFGLIYPDPRLAALGQRFILPASAAEDACKELGAELVTPDVYEAHRIALGIPRGGVDFIYGGAFPHETDMDQLHGISFDKGCYVGQEVVSRMQHRGTARTRIVQVRYDSHAPDAGAAITAGDKTIGTMGSSANGRGLAMVRLDRMADAQAAGTPLLSGGMRLDVVKPEWARFDWPARASQSG